MESVGTMCLPSGTTCLPHLPSQVEGVLLDTLHGVAEPVQSVKAMSQGQYVQEGQRAILKPNEDVASKRYRTESWLPPIALTN